MKLGPVEIKWEKRDVWIGLYWSPNQPELLMAGWNKNIPVATIRTIKWYVCIIPCWVIIWETRHVTLLPKP